MYNIKAHYVSEPEERSGCDLCEMNIYIKETYYTIENEMDGIIFTFCDMCKNKFIENLKKL